MRSRRLQALAVALAAAAWLAPAPGLARPKAPTGLGAPSYATRAEVRRFADEVAARHGLDRRWVRRALAQAHRITAVQRLMMPAPPGVAKDWAAYRERFVEPQRIGAGLVFWHDNQQWLERAQAEYGVPPEIVVGVIGVETFFGRLTGNFRVIDALATLAFDFPAGRSDRSDYFRTELENFLVWCARERRDPLSVKGSFAGAIGLPQFMPGSIERHAVDFDGDGRIDLAGSSADAIGSVAHYLAEYGWQRGLPPILAVTPPADPAQRETLLAPDIEPSFSAAQFAAHGAQLDDADPADAAQDGPYALVELENGDLPPSYVAGTRNFYALTRYNRSSYYAMAVIALGDAIRDAR
ncbi:MAG: lytic murein transglycosylase B [Rubrivivax sp. SCN 70-15]|nr:MAG: lytic murein transglycosylase B [Rubrivivax sp. SCN 70-15]